ncbi:MAG: flagellin, partial [Gammaproteobacteria bacterium]|nr:flagellin [Gammaproteobacteria bacterium]
TYRFTLAAENTSAVEVSFTIDSTTGTDALSQAVNAFNDFQAKTGVVATVKNDGSGISLTNYDGKTMSITDTAFTNSGVASFSGASGGAASMALDSNADTLKVSGQVTFDSDKAFVVAGSMAGLVVSAASETASLQKVADVDISTVSGANLALSVVDAAISQVSNQRAKFGALQSRFESTISNLSTSIENLSGARSRIRDADFAVETANLTRTQILQQAGTAMLAQANSIPQNVLSLLG